MISEKSLVAYKNRPALVKGREGDKLLIVTAPAADRPGARSAEALEFKVREKDLQFLHPGPCAAADLAALADDPPGSGAPVREAWELLAAGDSGPATGLSFKELAELIWGDYSPRGAWDLFLLLRDGLYFKAAGGLIYPHSAGELEAEEKKRAEKGQELRERAAFLERLKNRKPDLAADSRFLQDVEALAYGRAAKSRTMRDAGLEESPIRAHRLLVETGFWDPAVNPHPQRFGLSLSSASPVPAPPPPEDRLDLGRLRAFAIDSPWSADPDDALSLETSPSGSLTLWVHVADPASSVQPDSPAEREARNRGATLYLPEGACRMLADESLALFALGLSERSAALSFKLTLNPDGSISDAAVIPSWVRVTRLSYEEADKLAALCSGTPGDPETPEDSTILAALLALGERNMARRRAAGAVFIELPELHIALEGEQVRLEPIPHYKSAGMVRECMLLAGEGAARWVRDRELGGTPLPFPYVGQEIGDLPADPLPGYAGAWQLRKSMRSRTLSLKPSLHQGLGLDVYTQVTSPLRRYMDLLAHQQIRAVLRGAQPLGKDDLLLRLGAGEAAMAQSVQAERASRLHWTLVYLRDKIGSQWEGVVVEKKGAKVQAIIPALGLDTQVSLKQEAAPNETLSLKLIALRIPEGEAVFSAE
ncbi:MAG: RNB domain-containing ribonuclease [Treponema sp.]|jgi:exoribonuclease-2|nr:RNB domain-containing ribonuclease [Treponema sp.]